MARKKEDRNSRRSRESEQYYQQGHQYYQDPNGNYYQQNPGYQDQGGAYYQQNPGYQDQGGAYYQQNPGYQDQGGAYYQQNPGYQDPNGAYYQQGMNGQNYYQDQGGAYYQQGMNGQPYYQPGMGEVPAGKGKKKKGRRVRKVVLFIVEVLLLAILAVGLYVGATLSKLDTVEIEEDTIVENVKVQLDEKVVEKLKGYWNIALFGVDSRYASTESALSDTIIVASINKDTKEIKLVSVYRDTYLDQTNGEFSKANEAYIMGGASRAINMLNRNLDLDITNFVTVNMNVLAEVVNAIGGVEIDVREEEIEWINNYQNEGSEITGLEKIPVTYAGVQTLNGLQAMSYCRIRYIGLDYERTERQRKVLNKIFEKVQSMDIISLTGIIDDVLPYISTNLTQAEILSLAKDVTSYKMGENTGFPFDKLATDTDAGDTVVPVNLASNVTQLHEFLFGSEEAYVPSETVQSISDTIMNRTGVY